ncbi:MAG: hypothetical protein Q8P67_20490 [archaeon]|nr:hypothetical protein [archaeon]
MEGLAPSHLIKISCHLNEIKKEKLDKEKEREREKERKRNDTYIVISINHFLGCAINHPLGSITLLNLIVLVEHGLHLVLLHALLHQIERPRDVALGQQVEVVIGEEIPHNEQADEKEQDVAHQAHFFVWKQEPFF